MKKMLITAAATLALAVAITPSLVSQSVAAVQVKSQYCNMAKSQRNPVSWNSQYGCLDRDQVAAARAEARAPARTTHAKKPYCDQAKSQRNPVSWNAQYGCLNR